MDVRWRGTRDRDSARTVRPLDAALPIAFVSGAGALRPHLDLPGRSGTGRAPENSGDCRTGRSRPLGVRAARFHVEGPLLDDHRQRERLQPRIPAPALQTVRGFQADALRSHRRQRASQLSHQGRPGPHFQVFRRPQTGRYQPHGPVLRISLPMVQYRRQDQALVFRAAHRRADHARVLPLLFRSAQDSAAPCAHPAMADGRGSEDRQPGTHRAAAEPGRFCGGGGAGGPREALGRAAGGVESGGRDVSTPHHPAVGGAPLPRTQPHHFDCAMNRNYSTAEGSEALQSAERALECLAARQSADGCWEGEVVWCPMITAQYVIARRILGRPIDPSTRQGLVHYFEVTRRDGVGWGLHPESQPYVFVTALVYVALRLLGAGPDDPLPRSAREWLLAQPGGVTAIPTWGKFWLALIGLYEYSGMNPVPPELFLLPRTLPVHPDKLYCHTRYIYLGIAYLYGRRFRVELPEADDLREELYPGGYERVDFRRYRHRLAPSDVYVAPSAMLRLAYEVLNIAERLIPAALRRRALAYCGSRIVYEQRAS